MEIDPFPASDFDRWAGTYDQDVLDETSFPFIGYQQVLAAVVRLAQAHPGMRLLDLGTGTGNLAAPFAALGCEVWATDFSAEMLSLARRKLPAVHFFLADLRLGWPPELEGPFDRIVSAYVFHHFDLVQKVSLCAALARHLAPQGRLVIADIAFPDQAALDTVRRHLGAAWEEEFYWVADESLAVLRQAGLKADFEQISSCAGVLVVEPL